MHEPNPNFDILHFEMKIVTPVTQFTAEDGQIDGQHPYCGLLG